MTLQLADAPLFLCRKEAWNHIPQTSVIRLLERCAPDRLRQLLSTKASPVAVQALALLGSDTALLAVDALAIRYRSQFKNIGKAATEAFAAAAAARGLTPDELGDLARISGKSTEATPAVQE